MAYGTLTIEFFREKDSYDNYLKRSKLIRSLEKILLGMVPSSFMILMLLSFLNYPIVPINNPEFTINYFITLILVISMFGGMIGFIIATIKHDKIKKECSYNDIKIDFIFMYESLVSYNKYLRTKVLVDKRDTIENLDKSIKIIKEWDYGNIPFIFNKYKLHIDFIQNEFKLVLIQMIDSKEENMVKEAKNLLFRFSEFLLYKKENILQNLYEDAIQYKQEEDILVWKITIKDKIGIYIKNHQVISQLIFTSLCLFSGFYLGTKYGATKIELLFLYVAVIGSSIPVFKWIKKSVFQLDT